jgi:hypothetical protein
MVRGFVLFVTCVLAIELAVALKDTELPRKKLAGPPSEFADNEIPTPLYGAIAEDSAYLEIIMTPKKADKEKTKMVFKTSLMVDSSEEFTFSVFSKVQGIVLELTDPNGDEIDLSEHAIKGEFPIGSHAIPETTYRFTYPTVGVYQLKISTEHKLSGEKLLQMQASAPHGAIILWNKSKTRAHTHLNTYGLQVNSQVGLLTSITKDEKIVAGVRPTVVKDVIQEAELDLVLPDGSEVDVPMHDDGLHGDLEANDGIWGATVTATEPGVYSAMAWVSGTDENGNAFLRTTQHLIPVVADSITFNGAATGSLIDKEHMSINIPVNAKSDTTDKLFRAYAQVWGKDASGNDAPACWIGGMVEIVSNTVSLELDLKWLSLSQVSTPLTLKKVVIQETANYIPLDQQDEIPVHTPSYVSKHVKSALALKVDTITKEMRQGRRTRPLLSERNATAADGRLILIHGYCAGSNPWPANQFTQAAFFLNANANLNNQAFATKVFDWAEKQNGFPSYGVIGHSQGGMVGVHLLNYFETGLDDATGQRLIQSVGTPFQGCSAAGSAANLGKLFGAGCGSNTDLATDGAKLWLAGISPAARAEVNYYTTTYEQGKFFGDWCNLAMNAVLEWPNDGTTELDNAPIPGGKNMGNTEKWCHTTGMGYPPQYTDASRNSQMNAAAAR